MNCKKAARLLLLSFDGRLSEKDRRQLEGHVLECPSCQKKERAYGEILNLLRLRHVPEPLPYFEQRLMSKLRLAQQEAPGLFWQKWATRAAVAFFVVGLFFGSGLLFLKSPEPQELSQAEVLLLRNENPLAEAASILDQNRPEDRNMGLIFAAAEMRGPARR